MARRRGGRFEAELHADAQRLLAEAEYPPQVKQTILLGVARRPPRPAGVPGLWEGGAALPTLGPAGADAGCARRDSKARGVLALCRAP